MRLPEIATLIAAMTAVVALACPRPCGAGPCDSVVTYFAYPYQGSARTDDEWHVYDPVTRMDEIFLASRRPVGLVRWDTTFAGAFFDCGDTLYRIEWEQGAKPVFASRLPQGAGRVDWWFNPDSACWQVATMAYAPPGGMWCELWQSSQDGQEWRRLLADTVGCSSSPECDTWPWYDLPQVRQAPSISGDDLAAEAGVERFMDRMLPFDAPSFGLEPSEDLEWKFLPLDPEQRRGLAFRFLFGSEDGVSGPFYLVDLRNRSKTRIPLDPSDETSWFRMLVSERCGFLLVPGGGDMPLVVDLSSGEALNHPAWNTDGAVWVPRPRRRTR